jgi:trehalose synthase
VSEAFWKEVPAVGGISLQIIHGENGFLVNNIKETAEKTPYLLKHPKEVKAMGKNGREHVLENFLITRHLTDYLKLFNSFYDPLKH